MSTNPISAVVAECCIFCCKIYRQSSLPEDKPENNSSFLAKEFGGVEHRFVKVLEHHFATSGGRGIGVNLVSLAKSAFGGPEKDDDGGVMFRSCEDCRRTLSSFCDAVHRLRVAELEAEWRLKEFVELMRTADKAPGRMENFNAFLWASGNSSMSEGNPEKIRRLRRCLLETCSKKLGRRATPRVILRRCQVLQNNQQRYAESIFADAGSPLYSSGGEDDFCSEIGETNFSGLRKHKIEDDDFKGNDITPVGGKRRKTTGDPLYDLENVKVKQEVEDSGGDDTAAMTAVTKVEVSFALRRGLQRFQPKGAKPWKCHVCSKILASSGALSNHMRALHTSVRFRCHYCSYEFKLKNALTVHVFMVHRAQILDEFRTEGKSDADFDVEIDMVLGALTKKNGRQCDLCQKMFTTSWWCAMHIIQKHRQRLAVAFRGGDPKDGNIIEEDSKLDKTNEFNYCEYCNFKTRSSSNKTAHEFRRHPAEVLVKYRLKEIINRDDFLHGIKCAFQGLIWEKTNKCLLCNKAFSSIVVCQQHVVREHEDRFSTDLVGFQRNVLYGLSSWTPKNEN